MRSQSPLLTLSCSCRPICMDLKGMTFMSLCAKFSPVPQIYNPAIFFNVPRKLQPHQTQNSTAVSTVLLSLYLPWHHILPNYPSRNLRAIKRFLFHIYSSLISPLFSRFSLMPLVCIHELLRSLLLFSSILQSFTWCQMDPPKTVSWLQFCCNVPEDPEAPWSHTEELQLWFPGFWLLFASLFLFAIVTQLLCKILPVRNSVSFPGSTIFSPPCACM